MKAFINKILILILVSVYLPACTHVQNIEGADAQIQLGLAYLKNKNINSAKKKFILALQDAPRYPQAWDAMAYYMEWTGDFETAEKYYKHAIKLAPKESSAYNNYGIFLCKQKRYVQALEQFNLALLDKNYLKASEVSRNARLCAAIENEHF